MLSSIYCIYKNLSIISIDSRELLYGLPIHLFDILCQYLVRKNKNVDNSFAIRSKAKLIIIKKKIKS